MQINILENAHWQTGPWPIGAVSKRTRVNIETIRYYERIGLLPRLRRTGGGYRMYGVDQVKRLTFIRRTRELGFSLKEVRALLRLADDRSRACGEVRLLAESHRAEVRAKLADLRKLDRVLKELVSRCAEGTVPQCPLIEALYDLPPGGMPPETPRRPEQRGRRLRRQGDARRSGQGT